MFKKLPTPIDSENFSVVWEAVLKRLIGAKKKYLIEKITIPLGNISFLICCLLAFYGYLYQINQEILHHFLLSVPYLPQIWETVSPLFLYPELPLALQIIIPILVLYLVPMLVCLLTSGLVWLIYRPKSVPVLLENPAEDSRTLHNVAKELLARKKRIRPGTYFWCNIVFIVLSISLLAWFLLSAMADGLLMELFESIGEAPTSDIMLASVAPFIAYGILGFPFGYLLMLLYYFCVPDTLLADSEAYFFSCNPEEKARYEEENAILEKAKEIKERRRKEALFTKK